MFLEAAVSAYGDALMANPDSAITYQNLAIAHIALNNTDSAITYLKASLARKNDPVFWTFLVNAYVTKAEDAKKANNTAEADKYFNEAIGALTDARKADPANAELLSTLINVYIEAGRAPEALPLLKEAVAKDPSNKVFQNDLGLLLLQTNDLSGAVEHFDAAIATDPAYTDALRNGSVALMKMGQKEKEAAMSKADPKSGNVDKSYQKRFNKAAEYLEKYVAIKPDDANVWQALATAYGGADNTKKAAEALKKADALEKK
jgi:predicted Zn-dependent protease